MILYLTLYFIFYIHALYLLYLFLLIFLRCHHQRRSFCYLFFLFLFFLSILLDLLRFISLFFIFIGFVNLQRSFYLIFESISDWLHFHHQWLTTKIYLKILILLILSYYLCQYRFYIFLFQDVHIEFWYCNLLKQEITNIFGAFSWVLNQ